MYITKSMENRAMLMASKIKYKMFRRLDEGKMYRAFHLLARFNMVNQKAYAAEKDWSPGQLVDAWYETRVFESRF